MRTRSGDRKEADTSSGVRVQTCAQGRGLFAARPLPRGVVVARTSAAAHWITLPHPLLKREAAFQRIEDALDARGLPRDLCIAITSGSGRVGRLAVAELDAKPAQLCKGALLWYAMNHASKPAATVQLRVTQDAEKRPVIEWRTCRDVAAGQQLTFTYGQPDPTWGDAA